MTDINFDWEIVAFSVGPLLSAAKITIGVSLVTMVCAIVIGVICGIASLSHFAPLRLLVAGYVLFVRGIPPLVLVLLI